MTKYILAGGNERKSSAYGSRLATEVYKTVDRPAKILSCFFADPEPWQWELRGRDWDAWLRTYFGNEISYGYMLPDSAMVQVRAADVIYLHGGDNETLINRLKSYPELPQLFNGKVVIGSSAGANYLSRKYWTRTKRQVGEGMDILPYSLMTHYGSTNSSFGSGVADWRNAERAVRGVTSPEVELLKVREGQFVVVEV